MTEHARTSLTAKADERFRNVAKAVSSRKKKFRRLAQVIGALLVLGVLGVLTVMGLTAWTDHEWFASVGQDSVFWTQYISLSVVWLVFAAINFAAVLATARTAWRSVGATGKFVALTIIAAAIMASIMAASMAGNWMVFRLAVAQAPFGTTDPLFGLDIGFFVFVLPALESLLSWSFQLLLLCMASYLVIVMISTRLDYTGRIDANWPTVRAAFFRFTAGLMVLAAVSYLLKIWQLSYSTSQTSFTGASYTDVHAQLPGLVAMGVACIAVAVVLVVTARRTGFVTVTKAFAGLIALSLLTGLAVPYVVQRYWATPNEATAEKTYLTRNIQMTRLAYGLDQTTTTQFAGTDSVSTSNAASVKEALSGAPVWSASSVSQSFTQLQTIRPYYKLSTISTDRYVVNGKLTQVLVSAREISSSGLPSGGNTWVNRRLVYTHGYGMAISSASQTTSEGFPSFLVSNVPVTTSSSVKSSTSLKITQPRIYFGPDQSDWVLVNTGMDEFDYPSSGANATTRYSGTDGVTVGNALNRLAWAVRLKSVDLLVSGYVKSDSRILLNRSVVARAQKIAPWLTYDTPYPAIINGRITWLIDAYTTSDHFPYSQTLPNSSAFANGTNYVRSSVKVTVDAETGQTKFYAVGTDPIRDAWSQIFGSVISHDQIPAEVAAHLRVPQKLFNAQAQVFAKYHVSNPQVFYNREDLWRLTQDTNGKKIAAQYVLLDPGNTTSVGLQLLQAYVLPNRDDLVGWLSSSSEPGNYGKMVVYELPKSRVTLGPVQISARINQDPTISQQLTLWNQPGDSVQFGTMLVLPVAGSTVYLQPVFLTAQKSGISEMAGVIAVNGSRISLGKNLSEALTKVLASG